MEGYQGGMELEDNEEGHTQRQQQQVPQQKPIRRQRRSKKVPLIAIVGRPNVGKIFDLLSIKLVQKENQKLI